MSAARGLGGGDAGGQGAERGARGAATDPAADAARIFEAAFLAAPERERRAFDEALRAAGLASLPSFPRPALVSAAARARIGGATQALHAAVEAVGRAFFAGADLGGAIALDGEALDLARAHPRGAAPLLGCTRYDFVHDPASGRIAFLEANAGDPSGMGYNDALIAACDALPALGAVRARFASAAEPLAPSHRRALLEGYRAFAARRGVPPAARPRIVHAVASDSTVLADHEALARLHQDAGVDASVHDPRALRSAGGRVEAGGAPVDIVFRDTIDEWLLAPYWPHTAALIEAARAERVFVLNPLTSLYADSKGVLAVLSDPAFAPALREGGGLDEGPLAEVRALLPWTRLARPGPTTGFAGEPVPDLAAFALAHRDDLVLKPNAGWGGFGVEVGREADPLAWRRAVLEACGGPRDRPASAVLQRFAGYVTERYPCFEGARFVGHRPKRMSLSAWVHQGEVVGLFARASDAPVVNVHQGGGLLPVLVIGEPGAAAAP